MRNVCFFILLIGLLCNSCSPKVIKPELKLEERTQDYTLLIYESGTKIDAKGRVQCANFATLGREGNTMKMYGFRFRAHLGYLLDVNDKHDKYIVFEDAVLGNKFLDIHYEVKWDSFYVNKELILEKLLRLYGLSLEKQNIQTVGYELHVLDSSLLEKHRAPLQKAQGRTYMNSELIMPAANLSATAKAIDERLKEYIITAADDKSYYTIELNVESLDAVKQQLKAFGLSLSEQQIEIVRYKVLSAPSAAR